MKRMNSISVNVDVKELSKEIPIESYVYEYSPEEIIEALIKVFGKDNVVSALRLCELIK